MTTSLIPYVNFDGNCREAIEFYHLIFGGELYIQTVGEAMPDTPAEFKDRIMHAHLVNEHMSIMASDTHPTFSPPHAPGNNITLTIVGPDEEELSGYFEKLSEGGKVTMPLEKQFWGDTNGALIDKYGINWMINISNTDPSQ